MPKFNVKFTARLPEHVCGGRAGGTQERSENLYADDAAGAERKAREWWDVVEFHAATLFQEKKKDVKKQPARGLRRNRGAAPAADPGDEF
jgi:hypothetical protein